MEKMLIDISGVPCIPVPVALIDAIASDSSPLLTELLAALTGSGASAEAIAYGRDRGLLTLTGGTAAFSGTDNKRTASPAEKANFTPAEIDVFIQRDDNVRQLFRLAEIKLGKPLKYGEMNMFLGFYDWLRLPLDVIELLLDYCAGKEFASNRYIETIALDWADRGIVTAQAAREQIDRFGAYYRVIRAFCLPASRNPHARERAYMDKWLGEYGFSEEMIALAAERAIMNTGKASFAYADKVLKAWREAGVSTAEGADKLPAAAPAKAKTSGRRKAAYSGREWDEQKLDDLFRLENAYLERKLNEFNAEG